MHSNEHGELPVSAGAVEWLNDQYWHDSVLHELRFVRTGSADRVVLVLDLLSDWEAWVSREAVITFEGCWSSHARMNGGAVDGSGGEMIHLAAAAAEGDLIAAVRQKWKDAWKDRTAERPLAQFWLELSVTASRVEFVFESVAWRFGSGERPHSAPVPMVPE